MKRSALDAWLDDYLAAWRSNNANAVMRLFAPDAVYHYGPFLEPAHGREKIVANWTSGAAPSNMQHGHEIIAIEGDVGVAHWWVRQITNPGDPAREIDGVLVLRFDANGRCVEHREWLASRSKPDNSV